MQAIDQMKPTISRAMATLADDIWRRGALVEGAWAYRMEVAVDVVDSGDDPIFQLLFGRDVDDEEPIVRSFASHTSTSR